MTVDLYARWDQLILAGHVLTAILARVAQITIVICHPSALIELTLNFTRFYSLVRRTSGLRQR